MNMLLDGIGWVLKPIPSDSKPSGNRFTEHHFGPSFSNNQKFKVCLQTLSKKQEAEEITAKHYSNSHNATEYKMLTEQSCFWN